MCNNPKFRHEMKYEITYAQYLMLRSKLSAVMKKDPHANADGIYEITSLYFDNYMDQALREKLDGIQNRDKFRIRYYNQNLSRISLEKKSKRNNLCQKKSCLVTKEECEKILAGDVNWMKYSAHEQTERRTKEEQILLNEFYDAYEKMQLRPKTIVHYTRQAFIYEAGNVRITFDMDIRSGLYQTNFLDTSGILMPVHPDKMIMEVKYDEFLPDVIRLLVQAPFTRVGAFSKYASCRSME